MLEKANVEVEKILYPKDKKIEDTTFVVCKCSYLREVKRKINGKGQKIKVEIPDGEDIFKGYGLLEGEKYHVLGNKEKGEKGEKGRECFNILAYQRYPYRESFKAMFHDYGKDVVKAAEKFYDNFEGSVWETIDKDPNVLMKIEGVSKEVKKKMVKTYIKSRFTMDYTLLLDQKGFPVQKVNAIIDRFGVATPEIVEKHPYRLCEIKGMEFATVDAIVKSNYEQSIVEERYQAVLLDLLDQAEKGGKMFKTVSGHCCIPLNMWIALAEKQLGTKEHIAQAAKELLKKGVTVASQNPYDDTVYIYRKETFDTEVETANLIKGLVNQPKCKIDVSKEIQAMEKKVGFSLAPEQNNAVSTALSHSFCVITGGPGTGKTTIINFIAQIFKKVYPSKKICMLAPTARAAGSMQESTGVVAHTIHSALKLAADDDEGKESDVIIDAELLIVDEISMLGIFLARKLLKAVKKGCKVVLIGDIDQLPSIGAGSVLADMINSNAVPVARLNKVYRQNGDSNIAINANLVKFGKTSLDYNSTDFIFVQKDDFDSAEKALEKIYLDEVKKHGVENVVFLSPFRGTKTPTGVESFNKTIQDKVNPPSENKKEVKVQGTTFRVGDKIMQTSNNENAANGDIGYIKGIENDMVKIQFEGKESLCTYSISDMNDVTLAYATTVHKSQGSEYEVVLFNIQDEHGMMKQRNLFYTAITRAKKKVIIVGSEKAMCDAIKQKSVGTRMTMLDVRIAEK